MFMDDKKGPKNGPFVHNFNSSRVSSPPLNRQLLHKTHSSKFYDSPDQSIGEIKPSISGIDGMSKGSGSSGPKLKTSVVMKFNRHLVKDESIVQQFAVRKNSETPYYSTTDNSTRGPSRMESPKFGTNGKRKLKLSPL
jgi:hypothetical protein